MEIIQSIQTRIYEIRGQRVMLDFDLAQLYEVETKVLNQAVKRNLKRFPEDFMFQLTQAEFEDLKFQIETSKKGMSSHYVTTSESDTSLRSQTVTLKSGRGQHSKYLPYAFTEQGVAMLSGILNSDKAINMNIAIMRAFVEIRRLALAQPHLSAQLHELKQRIGEHDVQLSQIYEALENMLDDRAAQRTWNNRERIGFKSIRNS
jgi:hypothetical protein